MSASISKRFSVRVATPRTDELSHVSLGISNGSQVYITADGNESVEQVFADLRKVIDNLFTAVEEARREHFTKEVHPKLVGCTATTDGECPWHEKCVDVCRGVPIGG